MKPVVQNGLHQLGLKNIGESRFSPTPGCVHIVEINTCAFTEHTSLLPCTYTSACTCTTCILWCSTVCNRPHWRSLPTRTTHTHIVPHCIIYKRCPHWEMNTQRRCVLPQCVECAHMYMHPAPTPSPAPPLLLIIIACLYLLLFHFISFHCILFYFIFYYHPQLLLVIIICQHTQVIIKHTLWLLYLSTTHSCSSFTFVADEDLCGQNVLLLNSFLAMWIAQIPQRKSRPSLTSFINPINSQFFSLLTFEHLNPIMLQNLQEVTITHLHCTL